MTVFVPGACKGGGGRVCLSKIEPYSCDHTRVQTREEAAKLTIGQTRRCTSDTLALTSPPLLEPPLVPCAERHVPLAVSSVFASPLTHAAVDVAAHELRPMVGRGYCQRALCLPGLLSPVLVVWQQLALAVPCSTAPCSATWTGLQHQACAQAQPGEKGTIHCMRLTTVAWVECMECVV